MHYFSIDIDFAPDNKKCTCNGKKPLLFMENRIYIKYPVLLYCLYVLRKYKFLYIIPISRFA